MSYPSNQPIRNRNKNIPIKLYFSHFSIEIFANRNMVGFSFDSGGRRCIRPILEKYQSGIWGTIIIGHDIEINYLSNFFSLSLKQRKVKATWWSQKKKAFLLVATRFYRANFSMPRNKLETSCGMRRINNLIIRSFGLGVVTHKSSIENFQFKIFYNRMYTEFSIPSKVFFDFFSTSYMV